MPEVADVAKETLSAGTELLCVVVRGITKTVDKAFQLTDAALQAGIKLFLANKTSYKGEKSLPTLLKEGATLETIDVANADLKVFRQVARKYGVEFAIKKDVASRDPAYYVFFKSKDVEIMDKAFKEYAHIKLQKKIVPMKIPREKSIKVRLEEFKAVVQKRTAELLKKRAPKPRKAPGR